MKYYFCIYFCVVFFCVVFFSTLEKHCLSNRLFVLLVNFLGCAVDAFLPEAFCL